MVETALGEALGAGLTAAAFFASTPYLTRLQIHGVAKARRDVAICGAWHAEALARTDELPSLASLLSEPERDDDPDGLAADFEARRWAEQWGIAFETIQ